MRKMIDSKTRDKIYNEIIKGKSYRTIANKFEISTSTVAKIRKEKDGFFAIQQDMKKSGKTIKKIQDAAIINSVLKKSDLLIDNILNVGKAAIYGVEKLATITEKSEERVNGILKGLEELNEAVQNHIQFPKEISGKKERDDLVKSIYKTLSLVGSYYSSNKIVIDSLRELRGFVETYLKIKTEADIIKRLEEFVDAIFEGCSLISDEEYIKFRDCVIEKSEMGRQLFIKYDPAIEH